MFNVVLIVIYLMFIVDLKRNCVLNDKSAE